VAEPERGFQAAVEARLGRPFARVREQLEALFDREWEEVETFIATSAHKKGRSELDVVVDLIRKAEEKPPVVTQARRAVIRWIGKPWRERENPWERHKDRIPPKPPATDEPGEEWRPFGDPS
jgi:hypothetical protein